MSAGDIVVDVLVQRLGASRWIGGLVSFAQTKYNVFNV